MRKDLKETAWELFEKTGEIGYYLLDRKLNGDDPE